MKRVDPVKYLSHIDPILAQVIKKTPRPKWYRGKNHFKELVESIISQQLSEKAGNTIISRFVLLFARHGFPSPSQVVVMPDEKIRTAGISFAKIKYIKDLASKVENKEIVFDHIHVMSDEEVITYLTRVKGIGRWTAEMFLMFSLGREDIFSYGDLGLINAIKKLYKLKELPAPKHTERISSIWKPYRTWACKYLWASLTLK